MGKGQRVLDLKKYQTFLSDTKSTLKLLTKDKEKINSEISSLTKDLSNLREAQEVVSAVGILAQDNTKRIFEELVTQALQAVFGEEYSFELESRFSRNKPEVEMFVVENGVRYSPKDEKGGGIVHIISFALRIVSWAIMEPRSQNVLILDEPFSALHKDVLEFLSLVMKKISEELGLQIICITHENQLTQAIELSDRNRSFYVRKNEKGISKVERLENV